MIRPFDWRDLNLVRRLQDQGHVLNYEQALLEGAFPLRQALIGYLTLGSWGMQTLVLPRRGFVQLTCQPDANRAYLCYLSVSTPEDWLPLLEGTVAYLGRHGIHRLVVEAPEGGEAIGHLQRAGFALYAHQQIYRLDRPPAGLQVGTLPGLRPYRAADRWAVRSFYINLVPPLVRQAEGMWNGLQPDRWHAALVLEQEQEIIAHLAVRRGRLGHALHLMLHPQADHHADLLLAHGLAVLRNAPDRPIYCRVRRYQGGLDGALRQVGFEPLLTTAVLVRHTVARVIEPAWARTPGLETPTEVSTPSVPIHSVDQAGAVSIPTRRAGS
ncbi:MAG: hypothetical protein D6759_04055 [Chloroflexi bacterium]|nr:MAG: hypothetical protein D6759_04055 [Chloroflexota bacterium]